MTLTLKRFSCPVHSFQPILRMSKDPSVTEGLLYCFVCQSTLPLSKKDYLISIEDFLSGFYADTTSTERVKFSTQPPKEVQETLVRLERLSDLFISNALIEKNTALLRLNKLHVDFLNLIKLVRQSIHEDFDTQINFLKQRVETFKLTIQRHFEFSDLQVPPLTLERLFEEVNGCASLNALRQTLIRRLCDLKEIRDSFMKVPSQDTVKRYLDALADDIEGLCAADTRNLLCNDDIFQSVHDSTIKKFAVQFRDLVAEDKARAVRQFSKLWNSDLVSQFQFQKIQDQTWMDRDEQYYFIRRAMQGGGDMEELLRMYDVMENALMVLRDTKERLIFCFKRGRCFGPDHKNMTIMLLRSGESLKMEADEMPFDDSRRIYLTNEICMVPKDRVISPLDGGEMDSLGFSQILERAICFGVQTIDPFSPEKFMIMDAELFGVRIGQLDGFAAAGRKELEHLQRGVQMQ